VEFEFAVGGSSDFATNITAPGGEPLYLKEHVWEYCKKCETLTRCDEISGKCSVCSRGADGEGSGSGGGEKK
jgi:hypothetical protein